MRTNKPVKTGILLGALALTTVSQSYLLFSDRLGESSGEMGHPVQGASHASDADSHEALTQVNDRLRALHESIAYLQQRQSELVTVNEALSQRIDQLDPDAWAPGYADDAVDMEVDVEAIHLQGRMAEEEGARVFEQRFDEMWMQNASEAPDEIWTEEMEASLFESMALIDGEASLSMSVGGVSCSDSACAVEFAHQEGSTVDERSAFLDAMMPPGASEVIYKHVEEGGGMTLAIFIR